MRTQFLALIAAMSLIACDGAGSTEPDGGADADTDTEADGGARFFIQRAGWPPEGSSDWAFWEFLRVDLERLTPQGSNP